MCDYKHTIMTVYANVSMPVWQVKLASQNMQLHAYLCDTLCGCMHAFVAGTTFGAECVTTCMPVW